MQLMCHNIPQHVLFHVVLYRVTKLLSNFYIEKKKEKGSISELVADLIRTIEEGRAVWL